MQRLESMTDRDRDRILKLADDLKHWQLVLRRETAPHYKINTANYPLAFWVAMALKLEAVGGDPESFILSQHRRLGPNAPLNMFNTSTAFSTYSREMQQSDPDGRADAAARTQLRLVELVLKSGRSLRDTLLDARFELNPLICYCLARSGHLPDLAAQFQPSAFQVLRRYPSYGKLAYLAPYMTELKC